MTDVLGLALLRAISALLHALTAAIDAVLGGAHA